jgi:hypothetical protein
MKNYLLLAALIGGVSAPALAQTAPAPSPSPPSTSSPPPAARDTGSMTRAVVNGAPLQNGANSFTEEQAKARLQDSGITGVTGLTKDDNGIWRGRGSWQGRSVSVGLDFRGNISAQ